LTYKGHTKSTLTLTASDKIPKGEYSIKWKGNKNPRTTAPSGIFQIEIKDGKGNEVSSGRLETIQMRESGIFK
jgi:hypothetical protein